MFTSPIGNLPEKPVSMLLYGEPGVGKTTFAASLGRLVHMDFEGSANRTAYRNADVFQPSSWNEVMTFIRTGIIVTGEAGIQYPIYPWDYDGIIIDTVAAAQQMVIQQMIADDVAMKHHKPSTL